MGRRVSATVTTAIVLFASRGALAETYSVGPGKTYTQLSQVVDLVGPGDVIELDGDATYGPVELYNDGAAGQPITVRGVRVNGNRPVISGGEHTVYFEQANYWTFEDVEITGGTATCVLHRGANTVFRNVVIHDCDRHGILGTDDNSGSLLLEYCEIYNAGSEPPGENLKHPIYIATDSSVYPDAVFRMQFCYVHDAGGGNSVKSRARRTEIYYNWIEGAQYYEIEMIGPDGEVPYVDPREDGDVVGNILVQTTKFPSAAYTVRVGSDDSGETNGRYRFVNNLIISRADSGGPIRCRGETQSIELHNNAFVHVGGAPYEYGLRTTDCSIADRIYGSNNWYPENTPNMPVNLTGTIFGTNPALENMDGFDFRSTADTPFVNRGTMETDLGGTYAFPDPLLLPEYLPPIRAKLDPGMEVPREVVQTLDIGALEFGQEVPDPGPGGGGEPGGGGGGGGGGDPDGDGGMLTSSCGCRATGSARGSAWGLLSLVGVALALRTAGSRRRPRSRAR